MKSKPNPSDLAKMGLLTALICISAYIIIPLPFTPASLTAQTFMVNLIALLLPPAQAAFTMIVYTLLGLVGLPIFSGGVGGPGKLFGATGGYIFSWILAVTFISLLKGKRYHFIRYCVVTIFVGMPIIYIIGCIFMKLVTKMDWMGVFTASVLPFLPLDLLKCIAASLLVKPIQLALRKSA